MSTPSLPQRIPIIGPSCAGKTTLARVPGRRLGQPVPASAARPSPAHVPDAV